MLRSLLVVVVVLAPLAALAAEQGSASRAPEAGKPDLPPRDYQPPAPSERQVGSAQQAEQVSPEMKDAIISILQQQRNEAMDRGTVAAAQLAVAQRRVDYLEKALKACGAKEAGKPDAPGAPEGK